MGSLSSYKEKEKTYVVERFGNQFFNLKHKGFISTNFEDDDFILTAEQIIQYFSKYDENYGGEYNPIGISETIHVTENKYYIHSRKSYSQFIIEQIKNS